MARRLSDLQKELLHHVYTLTCRVESRPPDQLDRRRHWVSTEESRAAGNTGSTRVWWRNTGFSRSETSATSRSLKRLEQRGLVLRHGRPGNNRTRQVSLTATGRELAAELVVAERLTT